MPSPTRQDRIPSLDGLRALSIGLVLIGHLAGTRRFPLSLSTGDFLSLGGLGVHVFFVISGFLITGLLLTEVERHGRVDLGRFYFRRTLRILPPYYTLLAVLALLSAEGVIALGPHDMSHAWTYTTNYATGRSWYIVHTWSLSVEEQFYLLWPAVVLFVRPRKAITIAALVVLAEPVVRLVSWELFRDAGDGRFEMIADAIAIGCVLAGTRARLHRSPAYMRALGSPLFVLVPIVAFGANLLHNHPVIYYGVGFAAVNVGVALCIDWCVTFAEGRVGRVLNAAPLVFVGTLSYSLYLWQQLFINPTSPLSAFPVNLALAFVAAVCSYYCVERPALRLRRYIESRVYERKRPARDVPSVQPVITVES